MSIIENKGSVEMSQTDRLPILKLLALSLAGFIAIMTETMPAGLLPQISKGLGISETMVGQLITLFAAGSVVAAIPLTAATRSWSRKRVLLLAIIVLFLCNVVTTLSNNYILTLAVRFLAGMSTGLIWGLVAGYARRMVPNNLQGRALALATVGQPIALSLGVPLGTLLGSLFEWQVIFGIISACTLVLILWVFAALPDYPGQSAEQRQPISKIFMIPGVRPVLFVLFVWILAHNILYTYIAPFMTYVKLSNRLDLALLIFGVASVVGIWITGLFIDGRLRTLTLMSLLGFAVGSIVLGIAGEVALLIYIGIAIWGITFGGSATLLQTTLADAAGDGADVAQSMFVTVFNLAVAGGSLAGGLLLGNLGAGSFPWTLVFLSLIGLFTVWVNRVHAFKPN
ncbi:MFS transporter [Bacillus thuringiensis serovar yunnanensis]|nr:MFS transporter [Bacillus thuringiensis serovar yunnanensis]